MLSVAPRSQDGIKAFACPPALTDPQAPRLDGGQNEIHFDVLISLCRRSGGVARSLGKRLGRRQVGGVQFLRVGSAVAWSRLLVRGRRNVFGALVLHQLFPLASWRRRFFWPSCRAVVATFRRRGNRHHMMRRDEADDVRPPSGAKRPRGGSCRYPCCTLSNSPQAPPRSRSAAGWDEYGGIRRSCARQGHCGPAPCVFLFGRMKRILAPKRKGPTGSMLPRI